MCYDAVRGSSSCLFMPKISKISLQIDVANELKWTNICHWFVTIFTTWVIEWLFNRPKFFYRSKSTIFVLWMALALLYPAPSCQNVSQLLPQNVKKMPQNQRICSLCHINLFFIAHHTYSLLSIKFIIESFVHVEMYTKVSRLLPNQKRSKMGLKTDNFKMWFWAFSGWGRPW